MKLPTNIKEFKVLYDNVVVTPIDITQKRGVIIPTTSDTKAELGEVVSVGEGRIFDNGVIEPLRLKVGDLVYFNKYSTTKFNIDGTEYLVIREEDCIAYKR